MAENEKTPKPHWIEAVEAAGPDDDVFVYKPGTDVRKSVKKKDLPNLPHGWDLEPPDMTQDARLRNDAKGQKFRTFLEGAASSITLGGSDALIGGALDDEEYRARARENSGSRMLGQVAGGLLTLKAPYTPGGMAVKAGGNVGARVAARPGVAAAAAGGGLKAAKARALPGLAQNATEGAIFGAGEGFGSSFLSENPVSAEGVLANVASGALLGGGIGGGLSVGGSIVSESIGLGRSYFAKGARRMEAHAAKQSAVPDEALGRVAQPGPSLAPDMRAQARGELDATRGEYAKASAASQAARAEAGGVLSKADEHVGYFKADYDKLDEYSGSILRRIEKAGDSATPEMWAAHEALKQAREESRAFLEGKGVFKRSTAMTETLDLAPEKTTKRINDWADNPSVARSINDPEFPNVLGRQEEALARAKSVVDGPPEGRPGGVRKEKRSRIVEEEVDDLPFHEQVRLAAEKVPDGPGRFGDRKVFIGDVYDQMPPGMSLDEFKARLVEEQRAGRLGLSRSDLPPTHFGVERVNRSLAKADQFDLHFIQTDRFAPSTGGGKKRVSREVIEEFDVVDRGSKPWQPHKVRRDVFQQVSDYDDVMLRATSGVEDPALQAIQQRMDGLEKLLATGTVGSDATVKFARETVEAAQKSGIDASWENVLRASADDGVDPAALNALSPEAKVLLQAQYAREAASRQLKARVGEAVVEHEPTLGQKVGRGIMASAFGWAVGGHVGGILAAMVGGGFMGRLLKGTSIGLARKMAMGAGETGVKMAKGVDDFLGKAGKAARSSNIPRTAVHVLKSASYGASDETGKKYKGSALQQEYQKRADELTRSAASPGEAKRLIDESLIGVRLTDPRLADQLADLAMMRLQHLLDTMPKPHYPPNPFSKSTHIPSDAEIAAWARRAQIADHPEAIFDHMQDGTLTVEHVETLKAVYPKIYNEIHMDIITRAAELKATLPWERRVTLSTLFEAPTDDILRPELVGLLQASYSEKSTEQAPGQPQPPSTSRHSSPTKAQELAG